MTQRFLVSCGIIMRQAPLVLEQTRQRAGCYTGARAAYRRSHLLVPFAAATGAMLLCDAWFDVVTSTPGERLEALLQAGFAEIPLALVCAFVVYDVERVQASVGRLRRG